MATSTEITATTTNNVASLATTTSSASTTGMASMLQMLFGLFIVLAIILAAAWLLKRIQGGQGRQTQWLKPISVLSVGTRERVMIVEVEQQWLVVGVTTQQMALLHSLPKPTHLQASQQTPPEPTNFAEKLKQLMHK